MEYNQVATVIVESIIRARPALASTPQEDILQITLAELALDSLDTTTLSLDIEDACQVFVEPEDLANCETLADLVTLVARKR